MKYTSTLLISILLLANFSCRKETSTEVGEIIQTQQFQFDKGEALTIDISGRITNEYGTAVRGANVTSSNQTTKTDNNGYFLMTQVEGREKLSFVTVEAPNHFIGSRSFIPQAGLNQISIKLMRMFFTSTIDAETGGTVVSDGCQLNLGKGFINKNSGAPYTGEVKVALRHLNPTDDNFNEIMPGNLIAASSEGSKLLESFGMLAIELRDNNGNELQLSDSNSATFRMSIPESFKSGAPNSIPLWYYDEASGLWQEEGKAVIEGDEYVGEVQHFSMWNCDVARDYHTIQSRIINSNGTPMPGLKVVFHAETGESGFCYTAGDGNFKGAVPADMQFSVKFWYDNVPVGSTVVGPFSADQVLDDLVVKELDNLIEIEIPILDCTNEPLTVGYGTFNYTSTVKINSKGTIQFAYLPNRTFGLTVLDKTAKISTHAFSGQTTSNTLDPIKHCPSSSGGGTGDKNEIFVEYTFNDSHYYFIYPMPGMSTSRAGTGEYIHFDLGYSPNTPVHTTVLGMTLKEYVGPKTYTLGNQNPDMALWLDKPHTAISTHADSVSVTINDFYYINDKWLLDMTFSGRMNYWNPITQGYEKRMLTNGIVKWKYND